jgi:hypothetical protein
MDGSLGSSFPVTPRGSVRDDGDHLDVDEPVGADQGRDASAGSSTLLKLD